MNIKKLLPLMGLVLLLSHAKAQFNPSTIQEKYWDYRNRFRTQFIKAGTERGQSAPLSSRWDNADGTYCDPGNGRIEWGDGTSFLGHYMVLLATEYKMLKEAGQDVQPTLNELYYALATFNRLDQYAEIMHGSLLGDLNGMFSRDDVNEFTHESWTIRNNTTMTASDAYRKQTAVNNVCVEETGAVDDNNLASTDQIITLFLGFKFVDKCVDNVFVKPTAGDAGFYIKDEMKAIINRIMNYLTTSHTWNEQAECNFLPPGDSFSISKNANWRLFNPGTDKPIGQTSGIKFNLFGDPVNILKEENVALMGGNVWLFSYPLAKIANEITGADWWVDPVYSQTHINTVCLPQSRSGTIPIRSTGSAFNEPSCQRWFENIPSLLQTGSQVTQLFTVGFVDLHAILQTQQAQNNLNMFLPLALCAKTWSYEDFKYLCDLGGYKTYDLMWRILYPDGFDEEDIFNDQPPFMTRDVLIAVRDIEKQEWEEALVNAPENFNPHRGYTGSNWRHSTRIQHPLRPQSDEGKGYFSGVDVMLTHNLYRLAYNNTVSGDPFGKFQECSCDDAVNVHNTFQETNDQNQSWILDLKWTGQKVTTTSVQGTTILEIKRYHQDYYEKNIRAYDYMATDDYEVVNGGQMILKTDALVCHNNQLTVNTTGKLYVGGDNTGDEGLLVIRKGSKLLIGADGELIVKNNSRVVIEDGATLEIIDNGKITLDGQDAVLEIHGTLKLGAGVTFRVHEGVNGKGYVIFDIDPVTWSNTPNISVTGVLCKVELEGEGPNDKILVVKSRFVSAPGTLHSLTDYLDRFTIKNGKVELGTNSFLNIGTKSYFYNATFTRRPEEVNLNWTIANNGHNGLVLWGEDAQILNCTFEYGRYGVRSSQFLYGKSIMVQNSTFVNCQTGLETTDKGAFVYNTTFANCNKGWEALNMAYDAMLDQCTFIQNIEGVNYHGAQYQQLVVHKSNFNGNTAGGLTHRRSDATVECSGFSNANIGIKTVAASVNMSTITPVFNNLYNRMNKVYPGKNSFVQNTIGLYLQEGYDIRLDEGHNIFSQSSVTILPSNNISYGYVYGSARIKWGFIPPGDFMIAANNNSWLNNNSSLLLQNEYPSLFEISTFLMNPQFPTSIPGALQGTKLSGSMPDLCSNPTTGPVTYDPGPTNNQVLTGPIANNTFFYSPHVRVIPSGPFMGTQLREAIFAIFTSPYDPPTGEIRYTTIKNLYHLLKATNTFIAPGELETMDFAYSYYKAFLAMGVNHGLFTDNEVLKTEAMTDFNEIVNLRITRLSEIYPTNADMVNAHTTELRIDQGLMQRTFGYLPASLLTLQLAQTTAFNDQELIINEYSCRIEKENAVLTGTMTLEAYLNEVVTCPRYTGEAGAQKNGTTAFASPMVITKSELKLYPNPAFNEFLIELQSDVDGSASYEIMDINGRVIQSQKDLSLRKGMNSYGVDVIGIAQGLYFVRITTPSKQYVEKVYINTYSQR